MQTAKEHTGQGSIFLTIKKCKSKPLFTLTSSQLEWVLFKNIATVSDENVEKEKPFSTAGGNLRWYSHYWQQ